MTGKISAEKTGVKFTKADSVDAYQQMAAVKLGRVRSGIDAAATTPQLKPEVAVSAQLANSHDGLSILIPKEKEVKLYLVAVVAMNVLFRPACKK
jgi:hypothetical protein